MFRDRELSLADLFEAQVARTPGAVAAVDQSVRVSYSELNAAAERVARPLAPLGVGPETITGIYLDPSVDAVAALWGVLKTGGAYLPLDVSFPATRVAASLDAAGAEVIITRAGLRDRLPPGPRHVIE